MNDVVVVDANLALKWVLLEEDSTLSMGLLEKWTNERKEIIAPALFAYEVTNILHRQAVTGKLTSGPLKAVLARNTAEILIL